MKHCICMVSDFFYPSTGGVESHIFQLSVCLHRKGHKVIIVTHSYKERVGIRYYEPGIKVYYLPLLVFYNGTVLPSLLNTVGLFRDLFLRERISIVHGHSAFSTLAHEAMFLARSMGLKSVFTDHSLFGFADASAVVTNNFLSISQADCNHCICVSYVGKGNTVLRAKVSEELVSVIPNAIDTSVFYPQLELRRKHITIVMTSRLVYRKGVDILAKIMPVICNKYPMIRFLVAGDGPKRIMLEEVRENFNLQQKIELIGGVPHDKVPEILNQGHIYINTSLTEAFCMAIVEAVACGLQVVSTNVGGIPEVLPDDFIWMSNPTVPDLVASLENAINAILENRAPDAHETHRKVAKWYNWEQVASRTLLIYNRIHNDPPLSMSRRINTYLQCGPFSGPFFVFILVMQHFLLYIYDWLYPRKFIDECPNFPAPIKSPVLVKKKSFISQERRKSARLNPSL